MGNIVNGIHIDVKQGKVFFKSKQIDFNTLYQAEAEKTTEGVVFVPAQVFDGVVSTLVDTTAEVELVGKKVMIKTNTSSSEIYILDNDEDQEIEKPEGEPSLSIRREVFLQGLKSVQHASAESVVKPEIASVYMYTKDGSAYFVATDAFRLAETRFLSDGVVKDDVEVIMPIKGVLKAIRVMDSTHDTSVDMYIQEGVLFLKTKNILVRMNSVKGVFPDYRNIIPEDFDVDITVLKGDIMNFLKKARLFSNNLNKLSLDINNNETLALEFSNEAVGTTTSSVPVVIRGGVPKLPSFNYKFFSDALSVIQDDRVVLRAINDSAKPMMLRGVEDTSFTAIISPLLEGGGAGKD